MTILVTKIGGAYRQPTACGGTRRKAQAMVVLYTLRRVLYRGYFHYIETSSSIVAAAVRIEANANSAPIEKRVLSVTTCVQKRSSEWRRHAQLIPAFNRSGRCHWYRHTAAYCRATRPRCRKERSPPRQRSDALISVAREFGDEHGIASEKFRQSICRIGSSRDTKDNRS